jgi:hypothetical protein
MLAEVALLAVLSVQHGPGADGCIDEARLMRSVERRLKRRVFVSEARADLRFRVGFRAAGEQIEARIELSNRDGTSRGTRLLVTTGHCSKLDDSLALSLALLVDSPPDPEPEAEPAAPSAESDGPAPPSKPPPRRAPSTIEIPPEVAAPREPWHVAALASANANWGVLPSIRPALLLGMRIVPPRFPSVVFYGEAYWPVNAERDDVSGARFRLLRAGLSLCPELASGGRTSLGVCIGQTLGWLSAEGYGFDRDAKQQRLQYSFTLAGEARLRLFSPVSLRGAAGVELPLVRDRFASAGRNAQELFRPALLGISAQIGLEALLF